MHIKDRTFIITGGSSGLGLATCQDLYKHGGYISILDTNSENGQAVATRLGPRAVCFKCDVSNTDSVHSAVHQTANWIKSTQKPLAGIVSAAGVGNPGKIISRDKEPLALSDIDFVMNINVRGSLDFVRQCLPLMIESEAIQPDSERGVVILISSSAAYDGQSGQVAYAASKGAIRSMTLPMSRDLAQFGVRVVSIAPSIFESGMTALLSEKVRKSLERVMEFPKRPGRPIEFAKLVRHVIENSMLNGVCIRLDGAMRMPSRL